MSTVVLILIPRLRPPPTAKVDSLIPKDEELTPGLLYVLVATLTGSIIARNSEQKITPHYKTKS